MLLQQLVLPAVSSVGFRISEVMTAVELNSHAGICAQQVDLQLSRLVERNHQGLVQREPPLGLGKRFQSPEQELLRGAADACRTLGIRRHRARRQRAALSVRRAFAFDRHFRQQGFGLLP